MTKRHIEKLQEIEMILSNMYWELKENHEDREARRIDTINGKIHKLMNLDRKKGDMNSSN